MYAYTARIMECPHEDTVEISYADVWAMIDIPTKGRTHGDCLAAEEIMPDWQKDHMRDTVERLKSAKEIIFMPLGEFSFLRLNAN